MESPGTIIRMYWVATIERITFMNNLSIEQLCSKIIDERIDRMHYLCENNRTKDAESLYSEIRDWVIHKENMQVVSLEDINLFFDNF